MLPEFFNSKSFKRFELLLLYLVLPSLIIFDILSLQYRWVVYLFTFLYMAFILTILKIPFKQIRINKIERRIFLKYFSYYLAVVLITLIILGITGRLEGKIVIYFLILLSYGLISAPLQELFFRSFYFYRYKNVANFTLLAILNVILFSVYHKIFSGWTGVLLSLVGGIILTSLYIKYRNFYLNWFIHAILGVLVLLTGFESYFTTLPE